MKNIRQNMEYGIWNMEWVYSKLKILNSKFNLKNFTFGAILFLLVTSLASAAIVPCGVTSLDQADCTLSFIPALFKNTRNVAYVVVPLIAVVTIMYSVVKLMVGKNKAMEVTESKERFWKVATGIMMFFGGVGLLIMILNAIGLNAQFLNTFKFFFPTAILDSFSAHAYAAATDTTMLPNPLNLDNPLDFLQLLLKLLIRWIIFPVIIFSWLYSGFLYVKAQGNPQEITDAHKWLLYTFSGTVIIMLAETIFSVLRDTITNVIIH